MNTPEEYIAELERENAQLREEKQGIENLVEMTRNQLSHALRENVRLSSESKGWKDSFSSAICDVTDKASLLSSSKVIMITARSIMKSFDSCGDNPTAEVIDNTIDQLSRVIKQINKEIE